MNCSKRIRLARISAGLTQKELAQKMGVSAALVGQYETGVRNPKIDTLGRIAEALSLSPSFFQETQPFSDLEFLAEYKLPILTRMIEKNRFSIEGTTIQDVSDYEYWKCLSKNVISITKLDINLFYIQFTPDTNDISSESFSILSVNRYELTLDYQSLIEELTVKRKLHLETFFILQDLTLLNDQCIKRLQKQITDLVRDPTNAYI